MLRRRSNFFKDYLFRPPVLAAIGLIILILLSFPLARNLKQRFLMKKEISEWNEQIAEMEKKNSELSKAIEYLESDQFVEEKARLSLGLKKAGEQVVVIKNGSEKESGEIKDNLFDIAGLNKEQKISVLTNPQRWWGYFFAAREK